MIGLSGEIPLVSHSDVTSPFPPSGNGGYASNRDVILLTLLSCYKLNRCYIKLSLVNILENVFVFIEILFKMLLFKGGVLIYAEHCICICVCMNISERLTVDC